MNTQYLGGCLFCFLLPSSKELEVFHIRTDLGKLSMQLQLFSLKPQSVGLPMPSKAGQTPKRCRAQSLPSAFRERHDQGQPHSFFSESSGQCRFLSTM